MAEREGKEVVLSRNRIYITISGKFYNHKNFHKSPTASGKFHDF